MSRCHGATVGARARANLIDRAADSSTTKLGRSRCLANSNGVQSLSPGLPRTLSGLPWVPAHNQSVYPERVESLPGSVKPTLLPLV